MSVEKQGVNAPHLRFSKTREENIKEAPHHSRLGIYLPINKKIFTYISSFQ